MRRIMGTLLVASFFSIGQKDIQHVIFFVAPLLSGLILLFWSLTITVTDTHFSHAFNLDFWKRSYAFADIESFSKVQNSWLYGFGIRFIGTGWLYNVSGTDAILVQFKNGKKVRIGTDDQENLYNVLSQQLEE